MWNKKDIREHSIVMLKPNGFATNYGIEIMNVIKKNEFEIIKQKQVYLSKDDICKCFLHPTEHYIQYLTSGPVQLFLVKGFSPHERLYNIKRKIRQKYNVDHCMKNYLHTVDQGNEYHMFLHYFFPELSQYLFCNSADFNVVYQTNNVGEIIASLQYLDEYSNLRYIAVNISNMEDYDVNRLLETSFCNIEIVLVFNLQIEAATRIPLLLYLGVSEFVNFGKALLKYKNQLITRDTLSEIIRIFGVVIYLNGLKIPRTVIDDYRNVTMNMKDEIDEIIIKSKQYEIVKELKLLGIKGLICFRPDISLVEGEFMMDIARLSLIQIAGGSSGLINPGHFSVSADCINSLL